MADPDRLRPLVRVNRLIEPRRDVTDIEERRFDSYRAYFEYLPKGKRVIQYTMRLNNPGTFVMPASRIEAMYAPEMFGETPVAPVVVKAAR